MNFPKNIYQTWKTSEVPDRWKKAQQSVIDKNPNWNYTLLTDTDNENIVKQNFPDFYQTFISFPYGVQRADAIRYIILYLYGGIYLDLDYICNKTFDDLSLNKEVGLIKSGNTKNLFTNSFLVSQSGSNFWLKVIEQMKQPLPWYKRITKHFEIMNSTGPMMINKIANKFPNFVELLNKIEVPCDVCQRNKCEVDTTYYITPIEGGSWNSWDSLLLNYIYCNQTFLKITTLIICIFIAIKIHKRIKNINKFNLKRK